jgi:copper chaperone CopZ
LIQISAGAPPAAILGGGHSGREVWTPMSCCSSGAALLLLRPADPQVAALDVRLASRAADGGLRHSALSVPDLACETCRDRIEAALAELDGVQWCGVDIAAKRVSVEWRAAGEAPPLVAALLQAGYDAHLVELETAPQFRRTRGGSAIGLFQGWRSLWSARA